MYITASLYRVTAKVCRTDSGNLDINFGLGSHVGLSPDEARTLGAELIRQADQADAYALFQASQQVAA